MMERGSGPAQMPTVLGALLALTLLAATPTEVLPEDTGTPSQAVAGLQLTLSTAQTSYPVGSEYRLDIQLKNVSDRPIRLWIPHHRFDIELTETDRDGRSLSLHLGGVVSMHDFAAWLDDIVYLRPGASMILPRDLGRNVAGTITFIGTYRNRKASLKVEGVPGEMRDFWVGSVTSNAVTVGFYGDKEQ
jgi:hypothetical protein